MGVIYLHPYFFGDDTMDLFNHIGETRNEIMAVPFYGWIRNPVESMIKYAMRSGYYSKWENKYTIFRKLHIEDDPQRLFGATMQYTIDSFFKAMMNSKADNVEKADVEKDCNELIMLSDPKYASPTVMDLVFNRLLEEDFLQKLYIYSPVMTNAIKKVILDIFPLHNDKIFLTDGTIQEMVEYKEDTFTTIMVEDTDLFMNVLQLYNKEDRRKYMGNKYFILPAKSSLTESAKQIVQTIGILPEENQFKYKDFINATLGEVGSYADFLQLKTVVWG
jgi:hypothetical protein